MSEGPLTFLLPPRGPIRARTQDAALGIADLRDAVLRLGGIDAPSAQAVRSVKASRQPVSYDLAAGAWVDGQGEVLVDALAGSLEGPLLDMAQRINGATADLTGLHRMIASHPRRYLPPPPPVAPPLVPPLRVSRSAHEDWLTDRLTPHGPPGAAADGPVERRMRFVLDLLAHLPRPAEVAVRVDPVGWATRIALDLVLSPGFARPPMRADVADHRLVIDRAAVGLAARHRLDIALSHAFALAVGYGLLEASRDTEMTVRLAFLAPETEVPQRLGVVRVGAGRWLDLLDRIAARSLSEVKGMDGIDVEERAGAI